MHCIKRRKEVSAASQPYIVITQNKEAKIDKIASCRLCSAMHPLSCGLKNMLTHTIDYFHTDDAKLAYMLCIPGTFAVCTADMRLQLILKTNHYLEIKRNVIAT